MPIAKIKNISCISKSPCQEWRPERVESEDMEKKYDDSYYAWTGIYVPIVELNRKEINLLNNKPLFTIEMAYPFHETELSGLSIVSYSDILEKDEVLRMIHATALIIKNYTGNKPIHLFEKDEYDKLKDELRKNKVIMFSISSTA